MGAGAAAGATVKVMGVAARVLRRQRRGGPRWPVHRDCADACQRLARASRAVRDADAARLVAAQARQAALAAVRAAAARAVASGTPLDTTAGQKAVAQAATDADVLLAQFHGALDVERDAVQVVLSTLATVRGEWLEHRDAERARLADEYAVALDGGAGRGVVAILRDLAQVLAVADFVRHGQRRDMLTCRSSDAAGRVQDFAGQLVGFLHELRAEATPSVSEAS